MLTPAVPWSPLLLIMYIIKVYFPFFIYVWWFLPILSYLPITNSGYKIAHFVFFSPLTPGKLWCLSFLLSASTYFSHELLVQDSAECELFRKAIIYHYSRNARKPEFTSMTPLNQTIWYYVCIFVFFFFFLLVSDLLNGSPYKGQTRSPPLLLLFWNPKLGQVGNHNQSGKEKTNPDQETTKMAKYNLPTVETVDPASSNTSTDSANWSWILGTTVRIARTSKAKRTVSFLDSKKN